MPERRSKSFSSGQIEDMPQPMSYHQNHKKASWLKISIVILIIVVVVLGGVYLILRLTNGDLSNKTTTAAIDSMNWKAVFLTNGEIYFGTISRQTKDKLVLENIYYITKAAAAADQAQNAQTNLSLVKLGNEIFGPEDKMTINMQNVLYVEKLQKNSRIIELIKTYNEEKNSNKNVNSNPVQQPAPTVPPVPNPNTNTGVNQNPLENPPTQ
jgi:hypothetical protein